jgi:hypothetical protein
MEKDTRNRVFVVKVVVIYFRIKVGFVPRKITNSSSNILSTSKPFPNLQMMPEYRSKQYTENSLQYSKRRSNAPRRVPIFVSIQTSLHTLPLYSSWMQHSLEERVQILSGDSWLPSMA